jgi:hypothetical protein
MALLVRPLKDIVFLQDVLMLLLLVRLSLRIKGFGFYKSYYSYYNIYLNIVYFYVYNTVERRLRKMNKKLLIPLIVVLGVGIIAATGFVVNSFVIKSNVNEPFSVQYAIIGDGGQYDFQTLCANVTNWNAIPSGELDVEGIYAGESRRVCFKITNLAEAPITYTVSNTVISGDGTNSDANQVCVNAFGQTTETGTAGAKTDTLVGKTITVAGNAVPVQDCRISISVARG